MFEKLYDPYLENLSFVKNIVDFVNFRHKTIVYISINIEYIIKINNFYNEVSIAL